MADPRESIEVAMINALATISPANGYNVPKAIQLVTRDQIEISKVSDAYRPALVVLTELDESTLVMLGGVMEQVLSVVVLVYETWNSLESPTTVLNRYTKAVGDCLLSNGYWGGLALVTTLKGIPTHQIMTPPDVISTVHAEIRYLEVMPSAV
jgi:hypothetical protein